MWWLKIEEKIMWNSFRTNLRTFFYGDRIFSKRCEWNFKPHNILVFRTLLVFLFDMPQFQKQWFTMRYLFYSTLLPSSLSLTSNWNLGIRNHSMLWHVWAWAVCFCSNFSRFFSRMNNKFIRIWAFEFECNGNFKK